MDRGVYMNNVYIIFGLVLLVSFITGNIVLIVENIQNKKKNNNKK